MENTTNETPKAMPPAVSHVRRRLRHRLRQAIAGTSPRLLTTSRFDAVAAISATKIVPHSADRTS